MHWLKLLLGLVLAVAFLALGYVAGTSDRPPALAVIASFVPMFAIAAAAGWQLPRPWRWFALAGLAFAAGLGLWFMTELTAHVALMYFIQHFGAMVLLTFTFGSTVWGQPEEALCSRVAAKVLVGEADAAYMRYTWRVTIAWTIFFAVTGIVGLVLYVAQAMGAWAVWTMVATPVLVGAMFVVEYGVRVITLPNRPHMSIVQTIRAYRQHGPGQDHRGDHARP